MRKLKDKQLFDTISTFLLVYLPKIRNKSANTITSYRIALKLFIQFFEQVKNIEVFDLTVSMITSDSIVEFLDWLKNERNCSASTRNNRLSCLRSFYKYLVKQYDPSLITMLNDIAEIHKESVVKDQPPVILNDEEIAAVLAAPNPDSRIGIRDRCFLTILYDSGCRSDELRSLRIQDVTITGKNSKIHIIGKGGKSRMNPISEKATSIMKHYLEIFHPARKKDKFLFYVDRSPIQGKMSSDNAARIMNKYEKIVKEIYPNLPHLHPHLFRHTRAQNLYSAGMPLPLVSEWLGHSQMETSLIYAHADVDMKRKAIEKATSGSNLLVEKEAPKYMKDEEIIKILYGLC